LGSSTAARRKVSWSIIIQIMGPSRSEAALLRFGAWIERELGSQTAPIDPRT